MGRGRRCHMSLRKGSARKGRKKGSERKGLTGSMAGLRVRSCMVRCGMVATHQDRRGRRVERERAGRVREVGNRARRPPERRVVVVRVRERAGRRRGRMRGCASSKALHAMMKRGEMAMNATWHTMMARETAVRVTGTRTRLAPADTTTSIGLLDTLASVPLKPPCPHWLEGTSGASEAEESTSPRPPRRRALSLSTFFLTLSCTLSALSSSLCSSLCSARVALVDTPAPSTRSGSPRPSASPGSPPSPTRRPCNAPAAQGTLPLQLPPPGAPPLAPGPAGRGDLPTPGRGGA
mmetsp:Transcript_14197/g.36259  ORF Transcript_14197/g.36259 Transcript_14197/m.36259 type:complete len:293 (+) Transcript_14197:569-1447(+)